MSLAAIKTRRSGMTGGLNGADTDWLISEVEQAYSMLEAGQGEIAALRSQLSTVEGENERLRAENCTRQEMSFQAERRLKRLTDDALGALAGAVCTPEEGYVLAPQCLAANIRELRNMAEKAESELLQVKGERDRYREALETIAVNERSEPWPRRIARAALHPATEETE